MTAFDSIFGQPEATTTTDTVAAPPSELPPTAVVKKEPQEFDISKELTAWQDANKENIAHSFLLAQGCTCHILKSGEVWLASGAVDSVVPGVDSVNAKPLLMYSGGTWLTDAAKAFSTHDLNET